MTESPHYLLFSEASRQECATAKWRFVLQQVGSKRRFLAADVEPCAESTERLELLAVVRGLEALDGPARVTLVTKSRYVSRGIRQGIQEWRENDWRWERFGRIVPVRDGDLWQRVARALEIHEVDCQAWQFDTASEELAVEQSCVEPKTCGRPALRNATPSRRRGVQRRRSTARQTVGAWVERWTEALGSMSDPNRSPLGSGSAG